MRLFKKKINCGCAWARTHAFVCWWGGDAKPSTHCKSRRFNIVIVEKRRYIIVHMDDFVRLKFTLCV